MRMRLFPSVIATVLLLLAGSATAATGFISAANVVRGDIYVELTIQFNCDVQYLSHEPSGRGDALRIQLEPTSICRGVSPTVANNREMHRPLSADVAHVQHIEYDGDSPGVKYLRVSFSEDVRFFVAPGRSRDSIVVRVFEQPQNTSQQRADAASESRQVQRPAAVVPKYVINLESSQRYPATGDIPVLELDEQHELHISEAIIDGKTWYRIRIGYFDTAEDASRALQGVRGLYPSAWIDQVRKQTGTTVAATVTRATVRPPAVAPVAPVAPVAQTTATVATKTSTSTNTSASSEKIEQLMLDGRRAMTKGELSRAIQIYTKVLQQPPSEYQAEAQEFLGLARERNGQIAHAKAEYGRYLDVYPDTEGAERVRQRLSTLLVGAGSTAARESTNATNNRQAIRKASPWKFRTFFSQYYRRDVNQLNDQDEVVSQSSIYSDVTIDARRRGERFDFSTRLTGGYRSNLLDEPQQSGNDLRLSYFYVDMLDSRTRIRGRLGRQTRNTGGVLGRFDGLNLSYALTERLRFDAVAGEPVFSTASNSAESRQFYGLSSNFSPFSESLEFGLFYIQQTIGGMTDRQAVGAEVRYFGENKSLWGSADYDTSFSELGSAFLQASWRLPGNFTISGVLDRRRSPFLSLANALLGQPIQDFATFSRTLPEAELRQLALDRSAKTNSATLGLSRPLTPKLQFNINANISTVDAVPAFGDAPAMPEAEYSYYSADLVASSLFRQGDVGILSVRYSTSDSADVYSINLDARFPIGRAFRINPRLRVDYREISSDQSTQWIYTPGLRMQYRIGRRGRLEFEAGKRFSMRQMNDTDMDQESYFISIGYQLFY